MDTHPYYQRKKPAPQDPLKFNFDKVDIDGAGNHFPRIDIAANHLPPYPQPDPTGRLPDSRPLANSLLDYRAAAAVRASVGDVSDPASVRIEPRPGFENKYVDPTALLERKTYREKGDAPTILILARKCLAAMAYEDYFPNAGGVRTYALTGG